MTETEFLNEVNDALRLPPTIGTTTTTTSSTTTTTPSFLSPFSAMLPTGGGSGTTSGAEGLPGVFGGFSALAALPLATASAVGEGVAKGAEGVAGALAGLSLGLQGGDAGGAGAGFSTPPEAVEVREGGSLCPAEGYGREVALVNWFPLLGQPKRDKRVYRWHHG